MTRDGADVLLPEAENTADMILPPTEEEMETAITKSIHNIMAVVCASCLAAVGLNPNRFSVPPRFGRSER